MKENGNLQDVAVGIIGLGLMGTSIAASLLVAGHSVVAIAPVEGEKKHGALRIKDQLIQCEYGHFLNKPLESYLDCLLVTEDYDQLIHCSLVVECIIEDVGIKEEVFKKITDAVEADTIIASNTSAIPISILQRMVSHPGRFIGIHWAEPAFATRFLEIICGEKTSSETAQWVFDIARQWGKEPTLLKKDIRGFITNRLMYSVYREALNLVDNGLATVEDADKAFKYDAGSWITLMGIFRRMDFMGLKDYYPVFNSLFPLLSNRKDVPGPIQRLVDQHAQGTINAKGFYKYTEKEAREWDEAFAAFSHDIYRLAEQYPSENYEPSIKVI